jgi:nucleoid DNA-binding protein
MTKQHMARAIADRTGFRRAQALAIVQGVLDGIMDALVTAGRIDIRALAKAYIDEADDLNRGAREAQTNEPRIQIESRSLPEMIEKARRLRTVRLASEGM